ncbi:hypothetical protein E1286_37300 [Nonomuraea terrae]|uniref:Apolipoprotein N-acyltransferase n=1 Tax=Nonomuraea terrae TaxID=2530383 RepID=A0A4V2YJ36_9ACTN|nr:hypothetical protein [Nonomuraea terrae]TDD37337.1 hypothetical protein E1286_37300 [Nonomuraea terrae]
MLVELSGTSAAFDARGRPLAWIGPDYRGVFVIDVPLSREPTPYVRFGEWAPIAAAAVLLATGGVCTARRLRRPARY